MKFQSGCSGCFAGLSCQTRMEIIEILKKKKKMNVTEIAEKFKVSQPTITHHLKFLKDAGILASKKEGRNVFYFLDIKCGLNDCNIFS